MVTAPLYSASWSLHHSHKCRQTVQVYLRAELPMWHWVRWRVEKPYSLHEELEFWCCLMESDTQYTSRPLADRESLVTFMWPNWSDNLLPVTTAVRWALAKCIVLSLYLRHMWLRISWNTRSLKVMKRWQKCTSWSQSRLQLQSLITGLKSQVLTQWLWEFQQLSVEMPCQHSPTVSNCQICQWTKQTTNIIQTWLLSVWGCIMISACFNLQDANDLSSVLPPFKGSCQLTWKNLGVPRLL